MLIKTIKQISKQGFTNVHKFPKGSLHFIHIPKTGGTAIVESLKKKGLDIQPFASHSGLVKNISYPYVFTIIREPTERFLSAFWHHQTLGSPDHYWNYDAPSSQIRHFIDNPNDFINALKDSTNKYHNIVNKDFNKFHHFVTQASLLLDENDNIDPRINDIFIYSDNLSQELGLPIEKLNVTPKHQNITLTKDSLEFLKKHYKRDYEIYNYVKKNISNNKYQYES